MMRCFPCTLDFSQSNNTFYGISVFLNINDNGNDLGKYSGNFCFPSRWWKINWPGELSFFNISPAEFIEFCFNLGAKLDGHRSTWKGCPHYENYIIYQLYVRFEIR